MGETIKLRVAASEEAVTLDSASGSLAVEAVSPRVSFQKISGGTRLDITDIDGTKSTVLPDGAQGPQGEQGPRGLQGIQGPAGPSGRDGVSPTASVTQTAGGATVTVTDAGGTTTATLTNGQAGADGKDGKDGTDGEDGVSPSVSVTEITGGHRVSVTDATGTSTFDVMDGADGQDGSDGSPGADGNDGADGVTFTPSVSSAGVISWTNDGGRQNPESVNIKGPQGEQGPPGSDATVTVDTALSTSSTNPVQNKVITGETQTIRAGIVASDYNAVASPVAWALGGWKTSGGTAVNRDDRIRTTSTTQLSGLDWYIKSDSGVVFCPMFYDGSTYVAQTDYLWFSECFVGAVAPSGATGFRLVARTEPESDLTNVVDATGAKIHFFADKKQDTLTFDSTPTANSTNPVTSGGVKTAIDAAVDSLGLTTTGLITLDVSAYQLIWCTIAAGNYAGRNAENYQSSQIPVLGYFSTVTVTANAAKSAVLTFLKTAIPNTIAANDDITGYLADGETGRHLISAGTTQTFDVPSSAKYLFISTLSLGVSVAPASVLIRTYDYVGSQWRGKSWYAYGTSITSVAQGKYANYLAAMSGLVLTNKGIPGQGIGNLGATSTGAVYSAICNTSDGKTDADLITLETGANDCNADVPLGTIYDTGTSTLAGCLNDCLRYLQTNTNAQICVTVSPASKTVPEAANKYYEWADMVERICHINRVHFLRADNGMGNAKLLSSNGSLYVADNIHHTNLGGYIMAQNLWVQLRNIPLFYTVIP